MMPISDIIRELDHHQAALARAREALLSMVPTKKIGRPRADHGELDASPTVARAIDRFYRERAEKPAPTKRRRRKFGHGGLAAAIVAYLGKQGKPVITHAIADATETSPPTATNALRRLIADKRVVVEQRVTVNRNGRRDLLNYYSLSKTKGE